MGEDEARANALMRAKIQAVEDHFGTTVQQNNATQVIANGSDSKIQFHSQSESEVRGEWVETVGTPQFKVWYESGLVVKVTLRGYIRPIEDASTLFDVKILCNGTATRFERADFRDGDDLFMQFTSPVDGYIAVYLSDFQNVYCLLPYPDDNGNASPVKGGKTRVLFSYDHRDTGESVKQYHMTCDGGTESNMIYVCFSTNSFDKAIDAANGRQLPRMLSVADFHKWLSRCRRNDRAFQVKEYSITVTK